jgi:hypothetical protein
MMWFKDQAQSVTLIADTTQTVSATLEYSSFTSKSFVVNLAIMSEADPATGAVKYYVLAHECD